MRPTMGDFQMALLTWRPLNSKSRAVPTLTERTRPSTLAIISPFCPSPTLGQPGQVRCGLHLDLYVRSLHADRVTRDAARRGWAKHYARFDVVDCPMPRARHLLA